MSSWRIYPELEGPEPRPSGALSRLEESGIERTRCAPCDDVAAAGDHAFRPLLNREQFDDETVRVMGLALETVCIALRIGNSNDDVRQAIATMVIDLARTPSAVTTFCASWR